MISCKDARADASSEQICKRGSFVAAHVKRSMNAEHDIAFSHLQPTAGRYSCPRSLSDVADYGGKTRCILHGGFQCCQVRGIARINLRWRGEGHIKPFCGCNHRMDLTHACYCCCLLTPLNKGVCYLSRGGKAPATVIFSEGDTHRGSERCGRAGRR